MYGKTKLYKRKLTKTFDESQQLSCGIQESILTHRNQRFCFQGPRGTILFTTALNLRYLCQSDTVYGDGTFDKAPKHYLQLYTLYVLQNDYYLQVVNCFLPNKDVRTYEDMSYDIKYLCQDLII